MLFIRRSPKTKDKFNCQILTWMTDMVEHMVRAGIIVNVKIVSDSDIKKLSSIGVTMTPAFVPSSDMLSCDDERVLFGIDSIADFIERTCNKRQRERSERDQDSYKRSVQTDVVHDILMDTINRENAVDEECVDIDRVRSEISKRISSMQTDPVQRTVKTNMLAMDRRSHTTPFGDSIDSEQEGDVMKSRTSITGSVGTSMVDVADETGMDDIVRKFWENRETTPV